MVESVEPICSHLQAQSFFSLEEEHFHEAHDPILRAGAKHVIPRRVAVGPLLGRRECGRVEPLHTGNHVMRAPILAVIQPRARPVGPLAPKR